MLVAKDFRRYAREALKGRWLKAGLAALVAALLGASIFGGGPASFSSVIQSGKETADSALSTIPAEVFVWILGIGLVMTIYSLIIFVIGGATTLGYAKYQLNLVDDNNPEMRDIFSQYDRLWQGFLLQLLRALYTMLWTMLFVIPGIVAAYRYSMAAYILYENPQMTANEAITESKKLMVGNKWRLFCLEISFMGWMLLAALGIYPVLMLLGVISVFISGFNGVLIGVLILILYLAAVMLFLNPYVEAAHAAFYREIRYGKYSNPVVDADPQTEAFFGGEQY